MRSAYDDLVRKRARVHISWVTVEEKSYVIVFECKAILSVVQFCLFWDRFSETYSSLISALGESIIFERKHL